MKLVIFGLAYSSSWGNGHATLWRGLCRALTSLGCRVTFYERDVPYYAGARDLHELPGGKLVLYADWKAVERRARQDASRADVVIVTSYCPDGVIAAELACDAPGTAVFYDMDTPITLERLRGGERIPYLPPAGLSCFDLVLSFTGGPALAELRQRLDARTVRPLYGHVDPARHTRAAAVDRYRAALSYLGTYAADRQDALQTLFLEPARMRPQLRFLVGGAQYPADFPWLANIHYVHHVPPGEHGSFFASSRLTLNITRAAMVAMGWCPSGRLFEAGACGAVVLSDTWPGLEEFYQPGGEILTARNAKEALAAIDLSDAELLRIGAAARERTLAEHTSMHRARELLAALEDVRNALPDTQRIGAGAAWG